MSANPPKKKLNSVGIDQTDVVDGMIMIKFPKARDDFALNRAIVLIFGFILRNFPGAIEIFLGRSIDANDCAPAWKYI